MRDNGSKFFEATKWGPETSRPGGRQLRTATIRMNRSTNKQVNALPVFESWHLKRRRAAALDRNLLLTALIFIRCTTRGTKDRARQAHLRCVRKGLGQGGFQRMELGKTTKNPAVGGPHE